MTKTFVMPLYISDYMADTRRLTTEQHGAYFLLMMDYWMQGPPPDDNAVLSRIAGVELGRWLTNIRPYIAPFFQIKDEVWRHKRIDQELDKIESKREAGKAGARARWQSDGDLFGSAIADTMADRMPEKGQSGGQTHAIHNSNSREEGSNEPSIVRSGRKIVQWERDEQFAELWNAATPKMRERSKSRSQTYQVFVTAAAVAGGKEVLVDAMREYVKRNGDVQRTGGPGVHIWLKDGRWEPYIATQAVLVGVQPARWLGPDDFRAKVVERKGEPWTISWLDGCGWDEADRKIIAKRQLGFDTLIRELRDLLRFEGIGVRVKAPDDPLASHH